MKVHFEKGAHAIRTDCKICGKNVAQIKLHMETTHKPDSEKDINVTSVQRVSLQSTN